MKRVMIIFVVNNEFDNIQFKDFYEEYSKNIKWGYENINHFNVIKIRDSDILYLEKTGIIDIISEINDSFPIANGEDDLIMENDIKEKILIKINNLDIETNNLIKKIIILFKYAIKYNRWIHFAF